MRKNIFIFLIISFSLSAFVIINQSDTDGQHSKTMYAKPFTYQYGFDDLLLNQNDPDFFYQVSNRWSPITKSDLQKMTSVLEILDINESTSKVNYKNTRISILDNDSDVRDVQRSEMCQSDSFNTQQIQLIQSLDYNTNLRISTLSRGVHSGGGCIKEDSLLRYLTIIPEFEASYIGGEKALIEYLKENSKHLTANLKANALQPGKIKFTVTKFGTVAEVGLQSSCGFPLIDDAMFSLIKKMPNLWLVAQDSSGKAVDQVFVFSFGNVGC